MIYVQSFIDSGHDILCRDINLKHLSECAVENISDSSSISEGNLGPEAIGF